MLGEHPVPGRVLFLARGGPVDGAERQLLYLAAGLNRPVFNPLVLLDRDGPLSAELRERAIDTQTVSMANRRNFRGFFRGWSDAARIAAIARTHNIALVHASDLWKSAYALHVARRLRIPSVVHIRGPISPRDAAKHRLHRADALIPIAQRYVPQLQTAGIPADHICPVDDAVDIDRFAPNAARRAAFRERLQLGSRIAVGIVGRIEPFKRTREFLDIVTLALRQAHRDSVFLIVGRPGDQHYADEVRRIAASLARSGRILFTGRCEEMPALIDSLDILVTLSGGSVMFEAMANAKTVLSVREDGRHSAHTLHGQTACCVTASTPEPAAAALAQLIDDSALRDRLGAAARRWAVEHLSPTLLVSRTEALYRRLLRLPAAQPLPERLAI